MIKYTHFTPFLHREPKYFQNYTAGGVFAVLRTAPKSTAKPKKHLKIAFRTLRLAFHSWQTLGRPRSALQKHSVTAVPRGTSVTMNPSQPPFEFAEL